MPFWPNEKNTEVKNAENHDYTFNYTLIMHNYNVWILVYFMRTVLVRVKVIKLDEKHF